MEAILSWWCTWAWGCYLVGPLQGQRPRMKPRQVLVKRWSMGLGKTTDPPYIIAKENFIPIRFMSAVRLIMSKVVIKTRKTKEIISCFLHHQSVNGGNSYWNGAFLNNKEGEAVILSGLSFRLHGLICSNGPTKFYRPYCVQV